MKILLFDPRRYRSFRPSTAPLDLLSIATYLNKNGHEAVICDRSHTKKKTEKIIGDNKPDIIGASVITYSAIKDTLEIAACAKKLGCPLFSVVLWQHLYLKSFLKIRI